MTLYAFSYNRRGQLGHHDFPHRSGLVHAPDKPAAHQLAASWCERMGYAMKWVVEDRPGEITGERPAPINGSANA